MKKQKKQWFVIYFIDGTTTKIKCTLLQVYILSRSVEVHDYSVGKDNTVYRYKNNRWIGRNTNWDIWDI